MELNNNLTIVLTTHKLNNWDILIETIKTLSLNIPSLKKCNVLCSFAKNTSDNVDECINIIYYILTSNGFQGPSFVITNKGSQRESFCNTIKQVNTDFFYFTEHDWRFLKPVNIEPLVDLMYKNTNINNIYFNRRPNVKYIAELYLEQTNIDDVALIKTSKWALNPSIVRTKMWKDVWIPMLDNAPKMATPLDIEPIIHRAYKYDIHKHGFDYAQSKWGQYSYGNINSDQMIFHLDGSSAGKKDFIWSEQDIINHNNNTVPTLLSKNIMET